MPNTMRGVYTNITSIRRSVFTEVARIIYALGDAKDNEEVPLDRLLDEIPYKICPGDVGTYRESVFLERAIVSERVRLAMGMPLMGVNGPMHISEGLAEAVITDTYYEPPLINVISFACNACPDNVYRVTSSCQGCLAHPCREVCPKGAISFVNKRAQIDQEKCIKCGRCSSVCPYQAIHHQKRPCAEACGMHCISSDEHGRATIDNERCVSCGQCLIN